MKRKNNKTLAYIITYNILQYAVLVKRYMWGKLKPGDKIQLIIAIGILITAVLTWRNINRQGEFNKNLLRPWLSINPATLTTIWTDDTLFLGSKFSCFGSSPAHNLRTATVVLNNKDIPIEQVQKDFRATRYVMIVPGSELPMESIFPYRPFALTASQFIQRLSEQSLFLLLYYEFTDFDNNPYFYYILLSLDEIDTLENKSSFVVQRSDTDIVE
jgi:hypothetical protein